MPFSGALTYKLSASRELSGNISFSGALGSQIIALNLSGILSFAGNLTSYVATKTVSGILSFAGSLTSRRLGFQFLTRVELIKVELKRVVLNLIELLP